MDIRDRMGPLLRGPLGILLSCGLVLTALLTDLAAPPLGIPLALLLIWLVLWVGGGGLSELGLRRPAGWGKTIGIGIGTAVVLQATATLALLPLLQWLGADPPDISRFDEVRGDLGFFFTYVVVSWTTAGFGEELVWRGFLMGRVARLLGGGRSGWVAALIVTSALFGLGHAYQGPTGVVLTAFAALVFGLVYLAAGRNLWTVIIAHGTTDTLAFVAIYAGWLDKLG